MGSGTCDEAGDAVPGGGRFDRCMATVLGGRSPRTRPMAHRWTVQQVLGAPWVHDAFERLSLSEHARRDATVLALSTGLLDLKHPPNGNLNEARASTHIKLGTPATAKIRHPLAAFGLVFGGLTLGI